MRASARRVSICAQRVKGGREREGCVFQEGGCVKRERETERMCVKKECVRMKREGEREGRGETDRHDCWAFCNLIRYLQQQNVELCGGNCARRGGRQERSTRRREREGTGVYVCVCVCVCFLLSLCVFISLIFLFLFWCAEATTARVSTPATSLGNLPFAEGISASPLPGLWLHSRAQRARGFPLLSLCGQLIHVIATQIG